MTDKGPSRRRTGLAIYLVAAVAATALLLASTDYSARDKTTRDGDAVGTQRDAPWHYHWDSRWRVGLAGILIFTMVAAVEGYRRDDVPPWNGRLD